MKCEFTGCKQEAKWACRKLWAAAKGEVLHTCDDHKPDPAKRGEAIRHLPFFYDVQPIGAGAVVGYPGDVTDAATARKFLRWCCDTLGLGFHPDTEFGEYIEANGRPTFTPEVAARLDTLMAATFGHLPDVYAECMGMSPFKEQN